MDPLNKRRRQSETSKDVNSSTGPGTTVNLERGISLASSKLDCLIANFHRWKDLFGPEFTPSHRGNSTPNAPDEHEACKVYQDIIKRVESSTNSPPCDFEEFQDIMRSLGNPQDTWASIHVTGTNGKGTVCHKSADLLAGYNVHPVGLYTSPHITTIRERFVVDGVMISCLDLISLIRAVEETLARQFRFFQLCTLVGFIYFTMRGCKACVIEVGIGGKLDPTNVISRPLCAVITSISKDHTDILGDELKSIAENKAGIIKAECHVVVGPSLPEDALEVVRDRCAKLDNTDITIIDVSDQSELTPECINGITAREAVRVFVARKLRQNELKLPLSNVMPRGRLQHVLDNVVVDGGHNAMAMAAAAHYMRKLSSKIYVGIAMSKKRGLVVCNPLVSALGNRLVKVRYVQYDHSFRRPVSRLREDLADSNVLLRKWLSEADVMDVPSNQVEIVVPELIKSAQEEEGVVLFTGTFYFVGSVTSAVRARGSFFTKHTFC